MFTRIASSMQRNQFFSMALHQYFEPALKVHFNVHDQHVCVRIYTREYIRCIIRTAVGMCTSRSTIAYAGVLCTRVLMWNITKFMRIHASLLHGIAHVARIQAWTTLTCNLIGVCENKTAGLAHSRKCSVVTRPLSL